jgi:glutathione synthase/RimK-type ligase-like ATP-grasp enzyme
MRFADWVRDSARYGVRLLNPQSVVLRNMNKKYLLELDSLGIPTIPSVSFDPQGKDSIRTSMEIFNSGSIVIKPLIGAGGDFIYRFDAPLSVVPSSISKAIPGDIGYIAQPYLDGFHQNGEVSLIFFSGRYSHSVLKRPSTRDFRVQEQYGGTYEPYEPSADQIAVGTRALQYFDETLYARVDCVTDKGCFYVLEVELIEPQLYFDTSHQAAQTFARELAAKV